MTVISPLDRRRDLRGWLTAPLVTLVLAPALAISLGLLVAGSSASYPEICGPVATTNGCQETVFAMVAMHARIFVAGWLLLWALPWWRGLRPYRIAAAVGVGAVLLAAPLRLLELPSVGGGLLDTTSWDQELRDPAHTAEEISTLGTTFLVTALVLLALPSAGFVWSAVTRRRWAAVVCAALALVMVLPSYELARLSYHASDRARQLQRVPDPNPPCQVHSGSNDVCPGG